jgi:hypothetical protein
MKKTLFRVTVGAVIIALIVGALFALGYIYFGAKQPQQQVSVSYRVCDAKMAETYMNMTAKSADEERKMLNDFVSKIKKTPHNQQDPTCQTLLFMIAYRTEDYQGMRQPLQLVQGLYDQGIYANSNLSAGYSLPTMHTILKEVVGDA